MAKNSSIRHSLNNSKCLSIQLELEYLIEYFSVDFNYIAIYLAFLKKMRNFFWQKFDSRSNIMWIFAADRWTRGLISLMILREDEQDNKQRKVSKRSSNSNLKDLAKNELKLLIGVLTWCAFQFQFKSYFLLLR
jgi:hypothetical protein